MADVPFIVAHRAGNDLAVLRRAEKVRPHFVEADVHLYRGRLEVRHLKTLGPLPILWDRWYLASPRTPRLELAALLDHVDSDTALLLDLKGRDRRLSMSVASELGRPRVSPVVVCSRNWRLLEPFLDTDVRVVHSVGSRRQLRALRRHFTGQRLAGISIHQRLLDRRTVADLRARAEMIVSWPVASIPEARRLAAWGVDGVITERFEALAPALAEGAA